MEINSQPKHQPPTASDMQDKKHSVDILEEQKLCFDIGMRDSSTYFRVVDGLVEPLRSTVCAYFLVIRCLDVIEDETTLNAQQKLDALAVFSSGIDELNISLVETIMQNLRSDCKKKFIDLLVNYEKVWKLYNIHCSDCEKEVIRKAALKIAEGMMKYSNRPIESIADYNDYCHYAAGELAIGLSEIFQLNDQFNAAAQTDDIRRCSLAIGIIVQKLDIIQDAYEDIKPPAERFFYPKEVWAKYVCDIRNLIDENYKLQATNCLNELINDAFQHLPESIEYITLLSDKRCIRMVTFILCSCVAKLEKMFNNPAVFSSNVHLTKNEKLLVYDSVTNLDSCLTVMETCLDKLLKRMDSLNVSFVGTNNWILESKNFIANFRSQQLQK